MSFSEGLVLSFVVLFFLNLVVLIAYIGPILGEVREILRDVREVTGTVETRVKKIDEAIDKFKMGVSSVRGVSSIYKFIRRFSK